MATLQVRFRAPLSACRHCALRKQCIRYPHRTAVRQVAFFDGSHAGQARDALCTDEAQDRQRRGPGLPSRRLGIVEPVFGNIRHTKGLDRFTLRGREKVNAQWQLYCLVHNIEKIQRYGRIERRH